MEYYMPRHHRAFLRHLRSRPHDTSLLHLITTSPLATDAIKSSFNAAVMALKRFRDNHIRIAVLYIVSQAKKASRGVEDGAEEQEEGVMGTGGTDLLPFLKNLRDSTARMVVPLSGAVDAAVAARRAAGCPF